MVKIYCKLCKIFIFMLLNIFSYSEMCRSHTKRETPKYVVTTKPPPPKYPLSVTVQRGIEQQKVLRKPDMEIQFSIGGNTSFTCELDSPKKYFLSWKQVTDSAMILYPPIEATSYTIITELHSFDDATRWYCTAFENANLITSKFSIHFVTNEKHDAVRRNNSLKTNPHCLSEEHGTKYILKNGKLQAYDEFTNGTMICVNILLNINMSTSLRTVTYIELPNDDEKHYLSSTAVPYESTIADEMINVPPDNIFGIRLDIFWIIIGGAVLLLFIIIITVIIICIKCKKREEAENLYASTNNIITYASVQVAEASSNYPSSEEREPYAQIIGVIKSKRTKKLI